MYVCQPENKNRKTLLGKIWRLKHISLLVAAELNGRVLNLQSTRDRNRTFVLLVSNTFWDTVINFSFKWLFVILISIYCYLFFELIVFLYTMVSFVCSYFGINLIIYWGSFKVLFFCKSIKLIVLFFFVN